MKIICFSDIKWNFLKHRHHHVIQNLSKDHQILFIEPHSFNIFKSKTKVDKDFKNISVISIPKIPFIDNFIIFRKFNDLLIILWSKHIVNKFGFKNSILLLYDPRYVCVVGKLNEKLVWYDIVDDRPSFKEVKTWINYYINRLITNSNFITTSSMILKEKILQKRHNDIYFVGNGCDIDHFQHTNYQQTPSDIPKTKLIVGYFGTISDWFDFDLVEKILKTFPNLTVLLLGIVTPRVQKKIHSLTKYKNFFFLGEKKYDELPFYLNAFKLTIIPFKINELTRAVNPLKLYESCAARKPILSTDLPEINEIDGAIWKATDHQDFLNKLRIILETTCDSKKLISIAEQNSWDKKIKELKLILSNYTKNNE